MLNNVICKCGTAVPHKRVELGYRVCVECSSEKKWGAIQVVYHKTGNTVEIIKDPEVAAAAYAMSQRTGFGVMKGLTGNHRRSHTSHAADVKPLPDKPLVDKVLSRKPLVTDWYRVGEEAVAILEFEGLEKAMAHLENALEEKRIVRFDMKRLVPMIEEIAKTISTH